jgi:hypothetical protein
MKLLIELADGPGQQEAVDHLLEWLHEQSYDSHGNSDPRRETS